MNRPLRFGYTTGACAAAATKAAALLFRDHRPYDHVEITLPTQAKARFNVHRSLLTTDGATCSVIKDAGDDPDVTHGAELIATVSPQVSDSITIIGGNGIGRVTKPGLAVAVGDWAINPVPRAMIAQSLREVLPQGGFQVEISIPDGAQRALKTLNARLGIEGGLSILGTTGIVRPISAQAWTDTIDTALDVAQACGCSTVVLCTGRSSELAALRHFPDLPAEAFIMMGDHVAHTLQSCQKRGFLRPVLACQFAKLLKIACGHPNTHAAASQLDMTHLISWLREDCAPFALLKQATTSHTARELALTSNYSPHLLQTVGLRALQAARQHAPLLAPEILVCRYDSGDAIFCRQQTR